MDQFAAICAFIRVVETKSFSEASRQLGVAVSSVTRQVNGLERLLKTQLLNRSTRSITLTTQGYLYYEQVVRLIEDLEIANQSVSQHNHIPQGLLRVSLPVAFGRLYVASLLRDFLDQYPEVRLDLNFSDKLANLAEDNLDVIIRIGNLDRSGANWVVRKLASYSRLVCASPDYLQRYGIPEHPDDLVNHNCLCFSYEIGYSTWQFQHGQVVRGVKVQGSLIANNSEVLRQACLDGIGLILMPSWLIKMDVQTGRLQPVLEKFQLYPHKKIDAGIYALYLQNRRQSLKVQVFVDFLIQRLKNSLNSKDNNSVI